METTLYLHCQVSFAQAKYFFTLVYANNLLCNLFWVRHFKIIKYFSIFIFFLQLTWAYKALCITLFVQYSLPNAPCKEATGPD